MTNRVWTTYLAWGFFVGLPLLLVIVMLCVGGNIFAPMGTSHVPMWVSPAAGLVFMLGFLPLIQLLNVSSLRRRNPSMAGILTYTISEEGYTVQGDLFDSKLRWEAFPKAIETTEFLLLYVSARWAHFIPKFAATESQVQAIRAILQEKLGAKAQLMKT